MRRTLGTTLLTLTFALLPGVALACGGLVAPNGAVSLLRTTTFVGYVDGIEHYVTSFEFAGGEGEFGSIVPLPGIPSKIRRAGDWTLQRLQQEVTPQPLAVADAGGATAAEPGSARVIIETEVDALDIVVLEGGADEVVRWTSEHGFELSDDAPEVLAYYADRSPYFMAARFDAERAEELDQRAGDGTPIHLWIPTDDPWIPLRILSLAKGPKAPVEADIFLLTERTPTLLPSPRGVGPTRAPVAKGMLLQRSEPASRDLLRDLGSDKGMRWLPRRDMWFSYITLDAPAASVRYDLAIDADGRAPSWRAAGLLPAGVFAPGDPLGPRPLARQVVVEVPVPVAASTPESPAPRNLWPLWLTLTTAGAWVAGRARRRPDPATG